MRGNRRQFMVGAGTVLIGALGVGTNALADGHDVAVRIANVNPQAETVTLENVGDEDVALGGYQMDWEYGEDQDQTDAFEDGVTIAAGAQLVVWTGFQSTEIPDVEYDYQIANYDQGRINDDDPDVVALLSPGGNVVATSDGEVEPEPEPEPDPPDNGDGDGDGDGDDGDEEDGAAEADDEDEESVEETDDDHEEEAETADEETDEDDC